MKSIREANEIGGEPEAKVVYRL